MAECMAAARRRAASAEPLGPDFILVVFDDGERRAYEISRLVRPDIVFSFLADPAAPARVYVDEDGSVCWDRNPSVNSAVVWSNKVDIDSDAVYVFGGRLT